MEKKWRYENEKKRNMKKRRKNMDKMIKHRDEKVEEFLVSRRICINKFPEARMFESEDNFLRCLNNRFCCSTCIFRAKCVR